MINKIFILLIFSSLYSCRNYDSKKYITHENEAIKDVIHYLISYDEMVKMNNLDTTYTKILLTSSLGTDLIGEIHEPEGFDRYFNVNLITDPEKEKYYKKLYDELCKKRKKMKKAYAPIVKGLLKKRILDYQFEYSNLQVELIPECPDKSEELKQSGYYVSFSPWLYSKCSELKENEYGFLYISRIIFNRCFSKGYLAYEFWCGQGCGWTGGVEIVKINGKWEISEDFAMGIAINDLTKRTNASVQLCGLTQPRGVQPKNETETDLKRVYYPKMKQKSNRPEKKVQADNM